MAETLEEKSGIKVIPTMATLISGRVGGEDSYATSERVKDVLATMSSADGSRHADVLRTVKDAEAQLDRAAGDRHADNVKTVKDAEAQLDRASGDRYADTVKTIKDAEAQLDRAGGDRYADIVKNIKDSESDLARDNWHTTEAVRQAQFTNEVGIGKTRSAIREAELRNEITESRTRDLFNERFRELTRENCEDNCEIKERILESKYDLSSKMDCGFKEQLLEQKDTQKLMVKLNHESEKLALKNHYDNLLQFKEAAMLADKHACEIKFQAEKNAANASRELFEKFCELKSSVRSEGEETRKLVSGIEMQTLRDRANRAEGLLSSYFTRNVAPTVP